MYTEHKEIQIPVNELEIGMNVVRLDRPWLETDFLLQGFTIHSRREIDEFIRQCEYVYIDTTYEENIAAKSTNSISKTANKQIEEEKVPRRATHIPSAKYKIHYINKISVRKEMLEATGSYQFARSTVNSIMDGIRIGRVINMNQTREVVNNIVDSIMRNNDALLWLTKLKEKDEYTAEHSINVCILSVAFARHLGHHEGEIRMIGLGAFLHDVGKASIPLEVLNKTSKFTKEDFRLMKEHPLLGRNLLMSLPQSEHSAIDVAYNHHERLNGQGYPRGLKGHQIPYHAQLVSLTDTYDAITSQRCYDDGRASMEALDIIYKCRGVQFDKKLAEEFIKCIGIYPPGSIIEMTNGEVGLILSSNPKNKLKPRIIIVLDSDKQAQRQCIIDLHHGATDRNNQIYRIAHELPNGKYGLDVKEFIKKGLKFS